MLKIEKKDIQKYIVIGVVILSIAIAAVASILIFQNNMLLRAETGTEAQVYEIYNNDEKVGTITDRFAFESYIWSKHSQDISEDGDLYLAESISIVSDFVPSSEMPQDSESAYQAIAEKLDFEGTAYEVNLSNGATFSVRSRNELLSEIDRLKNMAAAEGIDPNDTKALLESQSKMTLGVNYTLKETTMDTKHVLTGEALTHYLLTSQELPEKVYASQAGDTISGIAKQNNMTVAELLELNPTLQENTLITPAIEVNITPLNQVLEFTKMENETIVEEIPFEIEYKDDSSVAAGTETIEQEGKKGVAVVEYLVRTVNGEKVKTEQLSKVVTTPAVKQIVKRGTGSVPGSAGGNSTYDGVISDIGTGRFIWPYVGRLGFGYMEEGYGGDHWGMDILGNAGDPIVAADSGTVVESGWGGSFGYTVVIDHGSGLQTRYAHMIEMPAVNAGQAVGQGQVIGYIGSTGYSTANHLHFEVILYGNRINPRPYLP